ncbi:MAG: protein-L-isoaspartate O-methyltransferase [Gammaproteobacteria bacterium]|nr:protein-L-isoaspartate O-methyltransferase [Gammaproteobacteria bacterium]MBU1647602.1 protein-L-isoaspartate O-methyltransferase [Gammaproteobacteria bacterium]MBU1971491.1 protein-L-isoaspartate O-methyltransferase [Gammaproteobacteria bacterium]
MNLEQARFNMVEQQIRTWEVLDQKVLDLLLLVKREEFVPAAWRNLAFADVEIPLEPGKKAGATMFSPKIEAHALQALQLKPHEKVLEIGSGCGYMAALLAAHADHVWSLEIVPELAALARDNIARYGISNVTVESGDGLAGLPAHAPYDAIMVSGALASVPQVLLDQLKVGGRLFAIVGEAPVMTALVTTRVAEDGWRSVNLFETVAEPLVNAPAVDKFTF